MILQNKDPVKSSSSLSEQNSILRIIRGFSYVVSIITVLFFLLNPLLVRENFNTFLTKSLDRFIGGIDYRVSSAPELIQYSKGMILGLVNGDDYESINLIMSHEKLSKIFREAQNSDDRNYYSGKLELLNGDDEPLRLKARSKGDRSLHFEDINSMSFRVNLKGSDRYEGLEEFSIQRPIIRNYSWEYLISEIFLRQNLLTLKTIPVHLFVNGDRRGLYSLEEVPSKITLERQRRKEGPIFGLDEDISTTIDSKLDVYDLKDWIESGIYKDSKYKLYESFNQAQKGENISGQIFDLDEWARYFVLIDIFGSYHGAIPKSVKFYFNPVMGKFQPILFDAHQGLGQFNNFIFLDLLTRGASADCEWICDNSKFFTAFLRNKNFLDSYVNYLKLYSSDLFINEIFEIYEINYEKLDYEFYSRLSPADAIYGRGFSPYMFKKDRIINRKKLIEGKLSVFQDTINISLLNNNLKVNDAAQLTVNPSVQITKVENYSLKGLSLEIIDPTIFLLSGKTNLRGISEDQPLKISGPGMFIHEGGEIILENVLFDRPSVIKISNRNWSGAINTYKAVVKIDNLTIKNSVGEDAINFISSDISVNNLQVFNVPSDAVDSDFSNGEITNLICEKVGNDCLDLSESFIDLKNGTFKEIQDKAVSVGENSNIEIGAISIYDSGIGLVSKDGSNLSAEQVYFNSVDLPVAVFKKKPAYEKPSLKIIKVESEDDLFGLFNDSSKISVPESIRKDFLESEEIESLMYGTVYGRKTER